MRACVDNACSVLYQEDKPYYIYYMPILHIIDALYFENKGYHTVKKIFQEDGNR